MARRLEDAQKTCNIRQRMKDEQVTSTAQACGAHVASNARWVKKLEPTNIQRLAGRSEDCSQAVGNVLERHGLLPAPERERKTSWREFIRTHTEVLAAVDFFTAEVWTSVGLILIGESSLRHSLENYVNHFHAERNHQGKGNVILFPAPEDRIGEMSGDIQTRERLGGLLKFYYREAA